MSETKQNVTLELESENIWSLCSNKYHSGCRLIHFFLESINELIAVVVVMFHFFKMVQYE